MSYYYRDPYEEEEDDEEEFENYCDDYKRDDPEPQEPLYITEFTIFEKLPQCMQNMIWEIAATQVVLEPRTVVVEIDTAPNGDDVYTSKFWKEYSQAAEGHRLQLVCKAANEVYKITRKQKMTLRLHPNDGENKNLTVDFDPLRDTLMFHSSDFNELDIKIFLQCLTKEECNKIQKIALYSNEQGWVDSEVLPGRDALLLMNNLEQVTYLEDYRNARDEMYHVSQGHASKEGSAGLITSAMRRENPGWQDPGIWFCIDPYNF